MKQTFNEKTYNGKKKLQWKNLQLFILKIRTYLYINNLSSLIIQVKHHFYKNLFSLDWKKKLIP